MLCKTIKQCVVELDFNGNKVKQYEEIARIWQENVKKSLFSKLNFYQTKVFLQMKSKQYSVKNYKKNVKGKKGYNRVSY